MDKIYYAPSFYAHILQSIILLFAFIYFFINYKYFSKLSQYQIMILLLLSIGVIGIHGLTHSSLESIYGFNFNLNNLQ